MQELVLHVYTLLLLHGNILAVIVATYMYIVVHMHNYSIHLYHDHI